MIEHDEDTRKYSTSAAAFNGNTYLCKRTTEVPHECADPICPGNVNRLKLEAVDDLLSALDDVRSDLATVVMRGCGRHKAQIDATIDKISAAIAKLEDAPGPKRNTRPGR